MVAYKLVFVNYEYEFVSYNTQFYPIWIALL